MINLNDDDGVVLCFAMSAHEAEHWELVTIAVVLVYRSLDAALESGWLRMGPIAEADLRRELPRRLKGNLRGSAGSQADRDLCDAVRDVFGRSFLSDLRKRLMIWKRGTR